MAFELAAYGAISGLLYSFLGKKPVSIYASLIAAMIVGRIVWGVARVVLLGFSDTRFYLGNLYSWRIYKCYSGNNPTNCFNTSINYCH